MAFKIATLRKAIATLESRYSSRDSSSIAEILDYPFIDRVKEAFNELEASLALTPKRYQNDIEVGERVLGYACAKVVKWAMCKAAWVELPEEEKTRETFAAICAKVRCVSMMTEEEQKDLRKKAERIFAEGWEVLLTEAEEMPVNCVSFPLKAGV